ncbi:MAG: hypothetical protein AAB396_01945, partial [Patescibacteria group bacterium]
CNLYIDNSLNINYYSIIMENQEIKKPQENNGDKMISASILISALLIGGALVYGAGLKSLPEKNENQNIVNSENQTLEEKVIPSVGVELPVKWGNLGKQLIDNGVIDAEKFEAIYSQRGGLSEENKKLLYGENNGNIIINRDNAGYLLNLFWALGLGNKNSILENGPMTDSKYGGAKNFASTGGWTLAKGDTMGHYSKHKFINLTAEQQALVEKVSKNIYRPCCGNSTYFPDCNHGMAMLGLLELMASQGIGESEMYKISLAVNSYWFPDTYLTIAKYFQEKGVEWNKIDPKEILGADYSSSSGYQNILSKTKPLNAGGGGGCGV